MKKVFSLFLVITLILNFVSFSYADTNIIDRLIEVDPDSALSTPEITDSNNVSGFEDSDNDGDEPKWGILAPLINILLSILGFFPSLILKLIYLLPTIDGIIFNSNNAFNITIFEAPTTTNGTIGGYLQSSISAVYNAFRYLVTAVYIVVLVYLAIRMMFSSIGRQKAKYKELFKYWLIGLLMLFSFHWVMAGIVWLSNTIVSILYSLTLQVMTSATGGVENFLVKFGLSDNTPLTDFIVAKITDFLGATVLVFGWAGVFATPILAIIFAILLIKSAFSIIVTYFKRFFTILVLVLLFPIVVLSYVFDKIGDRKAQTLSIWIKEFVTNVMIQPIHALILAFIGIMFAKASDSFLLTNAVFAPIFCLLALRLIPMGEELLKKLFQISSQMGPGSHGIAGSVAQAGMALRGMREIGGSLKNNFSKAKKLRELRQAEGLDSSFKAAVKGAKNGVGGHRGIKGALAAVDNHKNSSAYKNYKKAVEKETGSKSMVGAYAKAYAPAVGVVGGVGSAITGASSGQFLSKAATNAAIEGTLMGALADAPRTFDKFLHGDATKAEDYEKRAKGFANMSSEDAKSLLKDENKEEIKKIAIELGVSEGKVRNLIQRGEFGQVVDAYRSVGNAMRWGIGKEDAKKYSQLYRTQASFDKSKVEGGGLQAVRDRLRQDTNGFIERYVEEDGTYAYDVDGNYIRISDGKTKGKPFKITSDMVGKSADTVAREILEADKDYSTLKAKVDHADKALNGYITTDPDTGNDIRISGARDKLQEAIDNRDKARDAFGTNSDQYKIANARVTEVREEVDTLSRSLRADRTELDSMTKKQVSSLLASDEASQGAMGITFAETAYEAVTKAEDYRADTRTSTTVGSIDTNGMSKTFGSTTTISVNNPATGTPTVYTMETPLEMMGDKERAISDFVKTVNNPQATEPQIAQAAYNMASATRGDTTPKAQVTSTASSFEIQVNPYDGQPTQLTYSVPKVTDPQVVKQANQDVCVSILDQPEVRAEYTALQSELSGATTKAEVSRVEKKIAAFRDSIVEKTTTTIENELYDPASAPATVFAGINIGQAEHARDNSIPEPPAKLVFNSSMLDSAMAAAGYTPISTSTTPPEEPFTAGTCSALTDLLDSNQTHRIKLTPLSANTFDIEIENSTELYGPLNADDKSMEAMFGSSRNPITLVYKTSGARPGWYKE